MIKRYCDKCGKEIDLTVPIIWWTITRHGYEDIEIEICNACYRTIVPFDKEINVLNKKGVDENPLAGIKPKPIPTTKHTFVYRKGIENGMDSM